MPIVNALENEMGVYDDMEVYVSNSGRYSKCRYRCPTVVSTANGGIGIQQW